MFFWGWKSNDYLKGIELRRLAGTFLGNRWATRESTTDTFKIDTPLHKQQTITGLKVTPSDIYHLLSKKYPNQRWTPSLQWMHQLLLEVIEAIANDSIFPMLEHDGLRWRARWALLNQNKLKEQRELLFKSMPEVVAFKNEQHLRDFQNELADAVCRHSLQYSSWKPYLSKKRSTHIKALRNTCSALSDTSGDISGYFTTDMVNLDNALLDLSSSLRYGKLHAETGLNLSCQLRLLPGNESQSWRIIFEAFRNSSPDNVVTWNELLVDHRAMEEFRIKEASDSLRNFMEDMIELISSSVPGLDHVGVEACNDEAILSINDVSLLLLDGIHICDILQIPVLVPKGLIKQKIKLAARANASESGGISANLGKAMIDVDWELALGDEALSEEELLQLANSKTNLVQIKGEWVHIDNQQAEAALRELEKRRKSDFFVSPTELLRITAELGAEETDTEFEAALFAPTTQSADDWLMKLIEGLPDTDLTEENESHEFNGALRPYQKRALSWLQFLGRLGLGGCLADDMGLGKTPTALAHIQLRNLNKPNLVICPLSVVHNWEQEAKYFTPNLNTLVLHGAKRPIGDELIQHLQSIDIAISTYGTITRDIETLSNIDWDLVICDEAQFIKNHQTHAAIAIRQLVAEQKVALTGTPVENRLSELWSILDAINPGMLGGISWFKEKFATPIEQKRDQKALNGMRKLTDPFILRRTKDDKSLVPDLPDKIEQVVWSHLTHEQAGLYQAVLNDFLKDADTAEGMKRRGLILATLTKLKQICNHPAHFLSDGSDLGERSGKVSRLEELLEEINEAGQRVLVFTQYRVMGDLLSGHLAKTIGERPDFLHGGITRNKRQKMIDQFQNESGPPALLISLKAGGTGLNLTSANRVIHFDRWWNPAVEDQATDRAWRIGQQKTVFVHKLVCRGTLEEKINQLLIEKKELAVQSVGTGDEWFTDMGTEQLREIFALNISTAVQE